MFKMGKNNLQKEKMVMLLASVTVLSALTLTGIYVKERNELQEENYVELSEETEEFADLSEHEKAEAVIVESAQNPLTMNDALESEFGAPLVMEDESTGLEEELVLLDPEMIHGNMDIEVESHTDSTSNEEEVTAITDSLIFSKEEGLQWPVVGKVLINYSMDKTVYFKTLDQYKYSPAVIIQAPKGGQITASADGKVSSIYYDPQYGNCVAVDLGSGYQLTYGQLADICVKEGDYIEKGAYIASVANPTKYFSKEGTNVYFQLSCNGEPCDPLNCMNS